MIKRQRRSTILLTFEGIEACGKTTQAIILESYLNALGIDTIRTRMPGGCEIAEKIRDILLDTENNHMATQTEMLLFGASYAQLVSEVVMPALREKKVVVCSRYFDSMYSYQRFGRRSPMKHLNMIFESAFQGVCPNITFLLDLPVEISIERVKQRGNIDRIESEGEDFYKRIYEGYQSIHLWDLFYKERVVRIDATQSQAEVWKHICQTVDERLFGNRETVNIDKSFERFIANSK